MIMERIDGVKFATIDMFTRFLEDEIIYWITIYAKYKDAGMESSAEQFLDMAYGVRASLRGFCIINNLPSSPLAP